MQIYAFYDRIAKKIRGVTTAENDGLVIRENARALAQVYPLGDLEIQAVAEIDDNGDIKINEEKRVVNWESYKFPENPFVKVDKTKETEQK